MASLDVTERTEATVKATTDGVFDTWAHYEASQHARLVVQCYCQGKFRYYT